MTMLSLPHLTQVRSSLLSSSELTDSPHSEVQRSRSHPVQSVQVGLVINQQLEHLVSAVEGRVVQGGLVVVVPDVHREDAGPQQALDHLGQALGGRVVEDGLLGVLVDVELGVFLGEPDEDVVAPVNV